MISIMASNNAQLIEKTEILCKKTLRGKIMCGIIDTILAEKPEDYEALLQKLEQQGFEVKRGKHTAVKGKGQKRFIRFRTLGTGYSEDEIKAVLEGKAKHQPYQKKQPKEQPFQLLVDIQGKMAAKTVQIAKAELMSRFNLSDAQSQAIVDMRLRALTLSLIHISK